MSIYVRTQDKKTLVECNSFHFHNNQIIGFDNSNSNENLFDVLGIYSTKEKALKVLDMIQEHIDDIIGECEVFQMPSDDEA